MSVSSAGGVTRWVKRALPFAVAIASYGVSLAQTNLATNSPSAPLDEAVGWTTNGPIVFSVHKLTMPRTFLTNSAGRLLPRPGGGKVLTNLVFDHFLPGSLSHLIWTNRKIHCSTPAERGGTALARSTFRP